MVVPVKAQFMPAFIDIVDNPGTGTLRYPVDGKFVSLPLIKIKRGNNRSVIIEGKQRGIIDIKTIRQHFHFRPPDILYKLGMSDIIFLIDRWHFAIIQRGREIIQKDSTDIGYAIRDALESF